MVSWRKSAGIDRKTGSPLVKRRPDKPNRRVHSTRRLDPEINLLRMSVQAAIGLIATAIHAADEGDLLEEQDRSITTNTKSVTAHQPEQRRTVGKGPLCVEELCGFSREHPVHFLLLGLASFPARGDFFFVLRGVAGVAAEGDEPAPSCEASTPLG